MRISRASQSGLSLASMMVIVTLVGGIAAALVLLSVNQMKVDQKTRDNVAATYMAEAGVEHMAHLVRKAHANAMNLTAANTTVVVDGYSIQIKDLLPLGTGDGVGDTLETEMTIDGNPILLTAELFQTIAPLDPSEPGYDPQALDRLTTTKMYTLSAECRFPKPLTTGMTAAESLLRLSNTSLGRVERVLEYKITPIFDKFAFWNGTMEVQPGPKAIFNGRLHTNGDLHIGGDTGLTINTDYLRAAGKVYRHRLDNGTTQGGALTIRDAYKDPYTAQNQLGDNPWDWSTKYESDSKYNSSWNLTDNWLNPVSDNILDGKVRNQDNESPEKLHLEPPSIDTIDPGGYYHQNADIVIQDGKVFQRSGSDLVDITSTLSAGTVTESTMFDAREAKDGSPTGDGQGTSVPVTVIDVALLQKQVPSGNGVIYAYRTKTAPATGSSPRVIEGVMLKNGATLANNTTFVSNGPAYVQGDFNIDVPAGADPSIEPAKPRKGAAVMADAVNLLSNAWDGTKTQGKVPKAKETTMNFALVTGNVPTVTDDPKIPAGQRYSGGLENLPRFHEDWSGGVKLNYQGSLMSLWPSKIATGRWGKGGIYSPPDRRWDFDARFGDPDAPEKPPLFPQTVHIDRTAYREGY